MDELFDRNEIKALLQARKRQLCYVLLKVKNRSKNDQELLSILAEDVDLDGFESLKTELKSERQRIRRKERSEKLQANIPEKFKKQQPRKKKTPPGWGKL